MSPGRALIMLWLKFKDEDGNEQRIAVDRAIFTIGRHSACDLTYLDGRLSREHLRFEASDGGFTAADLGSSNGSTLNGIPLNGPAFIKDGDELDLGGGLRITVEISAEETIADEPAAADPRSAPIGQPGNGAATPPEAAHAASPNPPMQHAAEGFPTIFFVLAPLLGLFVLIIVIVGIVLIGGSGGNSQAAFDDDPGNGSRRRGSDPPEKDDPDPTPTARSRQPGADRRSDNSSPSQQTPAPINSGTVGSTTEGANVERLASVFLRGIAKNDPRAFLTGEQASKVSERIKQLKGSSSLAENIGSAKKNSAAIKSIADSNNLKPQFLAVAAITKLGSSRGDVVQAAQSVAAVYKKLTIQIGQQRSDDALLMVAAYEQAANDETMKLRNLIQEATPANSGPTARTVRSIWYLDQVGKISRADFDRALTFLAIGVIAQDPKEFGVNAESLSF